MIGNSVARLTGSKRNLLALMASSAIFTAGCGNMATTASNSSPLSKAASLNGTIHGGNQPVVGAAISLFYVGQKPLPATLAATTTSDASGSFSFTKDTIVANPSDDGTTDIFSCPTSGDPLVYVLSQGGNTQNNGDTTQNNAAAAFIAVYGTCNEINSTSHVAMTEVTTVATMAAFQQFFDPTLDSLSADATGQQHNIVANIPQTVTLLADPAAGVAATSTILTSNGGAIASGVTVTATPEPGKVNLLANILSACINSATAASTSCTSLFAAATPGNSSFTNSFLTGTLPQPTDTLQAIYYMLNNPGTSDNLATIFGLAGGVSGPYQPALATQPTDWTIAINFTSTSTCGSTTGGAGGFISSPIDISIDKFDDVWIANSQTGTGNLSSLSSGGIPNTCVLLGTGGSKGGGTIDSAGNVWMGSGASLYRYSPSGPVLAFPTTVSPIGVAADGLGNIYFSAVTGSVGSLYEIPNAATAGSAVTPVQISSNIGPNPVRLMPDYQLPVIVGGVTTLAPSNIFVTSGSNFISEVSPSSATGNLNGFVTTTINTSDASYGLSIGPANQLYVSAIDSGAISGMNLVGGSYTSIAGFPYTTPASIGVATPTSISVDGRLNVWIPNNVNGTGSGSVSELGSQPLATALSPSTGYQKSSAYLNSSRALAVDQAGNVWVAGDGANFITEIVGAGVPIFQPYSLGLQNGRFQTIP